MEFPHEGSLRYTQLCSNALIAENKAKRALNALKSAAAHADFEAERKFLLLTEEIFAIYFFRDDRDIKFRNIELRMDLERPPRSKQRIGIMLVNEETPGDIWHLRYQNRLQKYVNELYASTGFKGMTSEQLGEMIAVKFKELTK